MRFTQINNSIFLCLLLATFVFSSTVFSQENRKKKISKLETRTFKTDPYEKIKISGAFDVELISGVVGEIILKSNKEFADKILIDSDDEILLIVEESNDYNTKNDKIKILVPIENLTSLSINGSASINSDIVFNSENFEIALNGSGSIKLELMVKQLDANLNGSGTISIEGFANNASIKLTSSGNFECEKLIATNAEVYVSGSGTSKIRTNEKLKARVHGSGTIVYYGNPSKFDEKIMGSGTIEKGE